MFIMTGVSRRWKADLAIGVVERRCSSNAVRSGRVASRDDIGNSRTVRSQMINDLLRK